MRSSGIGYYQPLTGGDATANVLGVFGKTMSDLGQLSLDDKKVKNEEALQNARLTLAQNADKRGDEELKLKADEVSGKNQYYASKEAREQAKLVQEALDKKNMVGAFRALHPKATANLSDEELMAWGKDIDKVLPKDVKIDKLDTRVTPEGDKILTYFQDGQIVEKNMGKVKTDWNESKKSSEIPQGWVSVGKDFHEEYGHEGNTRLIKDGRYIAPLPYVNKKFSDQSDSSKLVLDEEL